VPRGGEFIHGVVADTGCAITVEGEKLALRDRDDGPLKLEAGRTVVLYGTVVARRSKRHRRMQVDEVYVQTTFDDGP
jgi:hypothetical protein